MYIIDSENDTFIKNSIDFECEFLIKPGKITNEQFTNVLSVLKNKSKYPDFDDTFNQWKLVQNNGISCSSTLDITLNDSTRKYNGFRWSIGGKDIQSYCKFNTINNINYELMYKKKHTTLNIDNFDIRINSKKEFIYDKLQGRFSSPEVDALYKKLDIYNFKKIPKTYRLKNRYTFTDKHNLHSLDLTIIRSSYNPTIKFIDSNLFNQEKTYEIELEINKFVNTENIIEKCILLDSEFNDQSVILQTLDESLQNGEITEAEYISEKTKTIESVNIENPVDLFTINNKENHYTSINSCLKFIHKSIDLYPYIISKTDSENVRKIFKHFINHQKQDIIRHKIAAMKDDSLEDKSHIREFVKSQDLEKIEQYYVDYQSNLEQNKDKLGKNIKNNDYFIGPKPVSMIMNHLQSETLYSDYCVTDKADGQGKLLYIVGLDHMKKKNQEEYVKYKNRIYLIDQNLKIYETNYQTTEEFSNSLFNGEYMNKDLNGNPIKIFKIYDSYYINNNPTIYNELFSNDSRIDSRVKMAQGFLDSIKLTVDGKEINNEDFQKDNYENITLKLKTFFNINSKEELHIITNTLWNKYLQSESLYKYDGLIFTPSKIPVGYQNDVDFDLSTHLTWRANIKWKPEYENTIDFLVKCKKEKRNNINVDKTKIIRIDNIVKKYKIVELYVGKNSVISNSCNPSQYKNKGLYKPGLFAPPHPDKSLSLHIAYLEITGNHEKCYTKEWDHTNNLWNNTNEIINDDMIVEFAYDTNKSDKRLCWIPIKVRNDKSSTYKYAMNQKQKYFNKINSLINKESSSVNYSKLFSEISPILKTIPRFRNITLEYFNSNKAIIKEYFADIYHIKYEITQSNLVREITVNYGNNYKTANNVWKSINNPITEDILFGRNDVPLSIDNDNKYYNRDVSIKREKSVTIDLQNFHNRIIKNTLIKYASSLIKNDVKSLLDLATGKGGDLYRWYTSGINEVVGIDNNYDNIFNPDDGACSRRNQLIIDNQVDTNQFNIQFLVGDICNDIKSPLNYNDSVSSSIYEKVLASRDQFDIISIMFAIHYCFDTKEKLDMLIDNIDKNLKNGGILIGTCLDGEKVYKLLHSLKLDESIVGTKSNKLIWKITKKYNRNTFEANDTCLNKEISVLMSSINKEITEYLVNFDYLKQKLAEKKINLLSDIHTNEQLGINATDTFDKIYENLDKLKIAGNIKKSCRPLSDDEKKISFLSRYFIFQKM